MTTLRARLPKLLALLCAGLVLSGCVTMAIESDFEGDGPATHSMTFTIDTSSLGSLGQDVDPAEGLDEAQDAAEQEGYRVEQIRDGDIVGIKVSTDVEDSSDLGQVLNDLYNANSAEDAGEPIAPFSGTFSEEDGAYRLELTVDGDQLVQGASEDLGEGQSPEDFGFDLATIFDMSYTANMPGEIDEDETNGEILDDGRVQWELPLTGSATLTAVSSGDDGDDSNLLIWLLIGGIILLGLIGVAAVGFLIFMNRRQTPPAAADHGYPEAGPTSPPPAGQYGEPPASSTGSMPPPSDPPASWTEPETPARDVASADQPTRPMPPPPDQDAGPGSDERPDPDVDDDTNESPPARPSF